MPETFSRGAALWLAAICLTSCNEQRAEEILETDSGTQGPDPTSASSPDDSGEDDVKLDLPNIETGGADNGDPDASGCQAIDFLFVVDNSGSMQDEQDQLVASFPGFMDTIANTLDARNFHIMTVSSSHHGIGVSSAGCENEVEECSCYPSPNCCLTRENMCPAEGVDTCNEVACSELELDACGDEFGTGTVWSGKRRCDVAGDRRYMLESQPELEDTFGCVARVGLGGTGEEQMITGLQQALSDRHNDAEGCNEGFLRNNAILVVTIISDEDDYGKSPGDPPYWYQTIVDAKGGRDDRIVMLGLVGDGGPDLEGICAPYDAGGVGAEDSVRLREFVNLFQYSLLGSVCVPTYAPFFEAAVQTIDIACDAYDAEG